MRYFAHAGADAPFEIDVRATGGHAPALLPLIEHRVRTALRRFASHVRSVRVSVADINGPRGGVDKECTIAVRLSVSPRLLLIEDVDSNMAVAVDRAADRLGNAVGRAVHASHRRAMRA